MERNRKNWIIFVCLVMISFHIKIFKVTWQKNSIILLPKELPVSSMALLIIMFLSSSTGRYSWVCDLDADWLNTWIQKRFHDQNSEKKNKLPRCQTGLKSNNWNKTFTGNWNFLNKMRSIGDNAYKGHTILRLYSIVNSKLDALLLCGFFLE